MYSFTIPTKNCFPSSAVNYKLEFETPTELILFLSNLNSQLISKYKMYFLNDYEPVLKGIVK